MDYQGHLKKITNLYHRGKLNEAIKEANKTLNEIEDQALDVYTGALRRRAFVHYLKGDENKFLDDINTALRIASENNHEAEKGSIYGLLGIYYQQSEHNYEKALKNYQLAINIKNNLNDKKDLSKLKINLATLYRETNKVNEGKKLLNEIISSDPEIRIKINSYLELGRLLVKENNYPEAKTYLSKALDLAKENNFPNEEADCFRELARVLYNDSKVESRKKYEKAIDIYNENGYKKKEQDLQKEFEKKF